MKYKNISGSKPSKLSSYAGIAFGAAVGFGTSPLLSAIGVPQNPAEVADQSVREMVRSYPELKDLKPVLHDMTQDYFRRTDAVACLSSFLANYCYIKREKLLDTMYFSMSLSAGLQPNKPVLKEQNHWQITPRPYQ